MTTTIDTSTQWRERAALKPREAAAVLDVSLTEIYRMASDGRLPIVRVGSRTIRVPVIELRRMLGETA